MQNGNHVKGEVFLTPAPAAPDDLLAVKKSFVIWLPLHEKLLAGARFNDALTKPKVTLAHVVPQFMAWIIEDETYGMAQYFRGNKKLGEIAREIASMLARRGRGEDVPDMRFVELGEALLPYGERLTDKDHIAAGAAWQACFNCTVPDIELAMRYAISANVNGQPGNKHIAMVATINVYLRKVFDLLKA